MVVNETPVEREWQRDSRPSLAPKGAGLDSGTPRAGRGDQNRVFCLCFSDPQRLVSCEGKGKERKEKFGNVGMDWKDIRLGLGGRWV